MKLLVLGRISAETKIKTHARVNFTAAVRCFPLRLKRKSISEMFTGDFLIQE